MSAPKKIAQSSIMNSFVKVVRKEEKEAAIQEEVQKSKQAEAKRKHEAELLAEKRRRLDAPQGEPDQEEEKKYNKTVSDAQKYVFCLMRCETLLQACNRAALRSAQVEAQRRHHIRTG
jgi:hypothetical protein